MDEIFAHPEVLERQLSLFSWEAEALKRGELKRLLRPQSSIQDHIVTYTYGEHRLTLTKPWRCHFAQIGGDEHEPNEPLTLQQVLEAGLTPETFEQWKLRFAPLPIIGTPYGAREVCWLASFE